jgi:hypothetical protein
MLTAPESLGEIGAGLIGLVKDEASPRRARRAKGASLSKPSSPAKLAARI